MALSENKKKAPKPSRHQSRGIKVNTPKLRYRVNKEKAPKPRLDNANTVVIGCINSDVIRTAVEKDLQDAGITADRWGNLSIYEFKKLGLQKHGCSLPALFVNFDTITDAQVNVSKFHQKQVKEVQLWAGYARREGTQTWAITVKNIPPKVTVKKIKQKFSGAGLVREVVKKSGTATVTFLIEEDVKKAVKKFNNSVWLRHTITVEDDASGGQSSTSGVGNTVDPSLAGSLDPNEEVIARERRHLLQIFRAFDAKRDDFLNMIKCNYGVVPKRASFDVLRDICLDGMLFGTIRERCNKCQSILFFDGFKYECTWRVCAYSNCQSHILEVTRANVLWEVPVYLTNTELEKWCRTKMEERNGKNLDEVSASALFLKKWKGELTSAQNTYKKMGRRKTFQNYSFFASGSGLNGDHRYVYAQVHKLTTGYEVSVVEKMYKGVESKATRPYSTLDEAIKYFEMRFHAITGLLWENWENRKKVPCNFDDKKLRPLDLEFKTNLDHEEAVRISAIHDSLNVNSDDLRIGGKLEANFKRAARKQNKYISKKAEKQNRGMTLVAVKSALDKLYFILQNKNHYLVDTLKSDLVTFLGIDQDQIETMDILQLLKLSIVSRVVPPLPPLMTKILLIDIEYCDISEYLQVWDLFVNTFCLKKVSRRLLSNFGSDIYENRRVYESVLILGPFIMQLALAEDINCLHAYTMPLEDERCCCWSSIILTKASNIDSPDQLVIHATIDVEMGPSFRNKEWKVEVHHNIKRICLKGFREEECTKYGYIAYCINQKRVSINMVFLIKNLKGKNMHDDDEIPHENEKNMQKDVKKRKYRNKADEIPHKKRKTKQNDVKDKKRKYTQKDDMQKDDKGGWAEFICNCNSSMTLCKEGEAVKDIMHSLEALPYIYLGKKHESKLKDIVENL